MWTDTSIQGSMCLHLLEWSVYIGRGTDCYTSRLHSGPWEGVWKWSMICTNVSNRQEHIPFSGTHVFHHWTKKIAFSFQCDHTILHFLSNFCRPKWQSSSCTASLYNHNISNLMIKKACFSHTIPPYKGHKSENHNPNTLYRLYGILAYVCTLVQYVYCA